jgi:hypothetical protein
MLERIYLTCAQLSHAPLLHLLLDCSQVKEQFRGFTERIVICFGAHRAREFVRSRADMAASPE